MFKSSNFIFVGLVLVVAAATYIVKYGSKIEHSNVAKLEREIQTEKEAIDILKANWSLLTNPSRIQKLAKQHEDELQLEYMKPQQIVDFDQIPLRPKPNPQTRNAQINDQREEMNGLTTGSVKAKGINQ